LVNLNARVYDQTIGRFMTPDDIIPDQYNSQALNRFTYVENGPLSYTDPTGHNPMVLAAEAGCAITAEIGCFEGAIGGAIVGGAVWACIEWCGQIFPNKPSNDEPRGVGDNSRNGTPQLPEDGNSNKPPKAGPPTIVPPVSSSQNQGPRFFRGKLREEILDKSKDESGQMRCAYCGKKMTNEPGRPESATVDHRMPYVKGGSTTEGNGTGACANCNTSKGARTLGTEWTPPKERPAQPPETPAPRPKPNPIFNE
jgi:hypothetical protein